MDPLTITQQLGLTPEQTAGVITLVALSGFFMAIWSFIRPPLVTLRKSLVNFFVREIDIHISSPDFPKFNLWLEKNEKYIKFQRSYKVVTSSGASEDGYESDSDDRKRKNKLIAGYGTILIDHPDHPYMLISRKKEEGKQIYAQTETLTIQFLTLQPKRILKFFNTVTNIVEKNGPFVYECNEGWWSKRGSARKVSPPVGDGANQFIASVDKFLSRKDEYVSRSLPFKRGYLLHGSPGTGKTSIISHIANTHGLHIYILDSEAIRKFAKSATSIRPNSLVVIEDIDFTVVGEKRNLEKPVSTGDEDADEDSAEMHVSNKEALHGFLNALDGIVEINANLIVATTNSPESLDSALIRPGRFDEMIEIGLLKSKDQVEHINRFFGRNLNHVDYNFKDKTFAELQLMCTTYMSDFDAFMRELK